MSEQPHPFERLTPDAVMDAIEANGYRCDGHVMALNSYENRVYQVGIEDDAPLIVKFYRPGRWSEAQIREEQDFCFELLQAELPVIAPLKNGSGHSILQHDHFFFSLYPRQGGHAPELDNLDNLYIMGKLLGRMHAIGACQPFAVRPTITIQNFGYDSVRFISETMIPSGLKLAYDSLCTDIFKVMEQRLAEVGEVDHLRVHGDCHLGNILWRDEKPFLVDFDDARMAPAIQDIWMLLSGDRQRQTVQLAEIVEGYNEFHHFESKELPLIEVLRTLRIMNYSAWLARRWSDPAFPFSFPWFNTEKYWEEQILILREQYSALSEPPLVLFNA